MVRMEDVNLRLWFREIHFQLDWHCITAEDEDEDAGNEEKLFSKVIN